ncbi:MAG: TetR/AcrR family transcriptional regulator [Solirubrobacterales bacterium]|nr:TetR/AcrR family transcriptional regulator [Solirubrobacterales bacterium]
MAVKSGGSEARLRLRPDERHAEILKVARSAFARKGFAEVSMGGISKEVGVTPGLVNHYFGTKKELYLAVIEQSARRLSKTVRTDLDGLPVEERVRLNTGAYLDSIKRDAEDWTLLFGARAQRDPEVLRHVEAVRAETAERMARNQTGGREPSDELRLAMRLFQGTAEAAAIEWLSGRVEREQLEEMLVKIVTAIIEAVSSSKREVP